MTNLTTHVLDTMHGIPAEGMVVELFYYSEEEYKFIKKISTNNKGRSDAPILDESKFESGKWELVFHVSDYFAKFNLDLAEPSFLDRVPIRFGMTSTEDHYHVPLLVTPWSYSTYRGS